MAVIKLISPIDGSVYAERETHSVDEIETLISNARDLQKDWAERPIEERASLVMRAIDALEDMNDDVVTEIAHMMGRPVRYGGEIGGVRERAAYMAEIAENALQPTEIENSDDFIRCIKREPIGVVLVIAPWNYPYLTAINTIAPALIAGNAVLQAMRHLAMRYREDFQAFGCIPGTAEKTRAEQRNAEQEKFGFELQRADSQFRLIR